MTKPVKLTANQQKVVNLMAVGYKLTRSEGCGRNGSHYCSLRMGDKSKSVPANIASQLFRKGVVEHDKSAKVHWSSAAYCLTAMGKEIATAIEKPKPQRWWKFTRWSTEISPEEFSSSTDAYLIRDDGRKVARSSQYDHWFSTREAAVKALRRRLEYAVSNAESAMNSAQKALAAFNKREK